jgi:hypothetical protein
MDKFMLRFTYKVHGEDCTGGPYRVSATSLQDAVAKLHTALLMVARWSDNYWHGCYAFANYQVSKALDDSEYTEDELDKYLK